MLFQNSLKHYSKTEHILGDLSPSSYKVWSIGGDKNRYLGQLISKDPIVTSPQSIATSVNLPLNSQTICTR